ncbi:response regulator [Candidatus Falkowbacteria bacterium]|jgi:response regulator of citrate/malate metabolism|nr:response regulator [Deltaproteobacteria bacterium]MBT4525428.1 response regulator [Deltaproteobacteria bacterium]MBT7007080.1 response regulator [Candidatus Falkowbacteria bacterium]
MKQYQVLIAEDDFRVAGIWKEFTEKDSNFSVVADVRNGEEALKILKENKIDLIIMDVYMPEMDGYQLLLELRKKETSIDVIAVTAAKETQMIQRFFRLGVIDYIIKPCVYERYKKALDRFLQINNAFQGEDFEQQTLDALILNETVSQSITRKLPKGMQQITMDRIISKFNENPFSQSAEELTKETGLSIATIQRYLRYLAKEKIIKKELTYGTQGRPEHKYSKM